MVISLKDIIEKKSFNSKEEEIIISIFKELSDDFNKSNFEFNKGILTFKNIGSSMKMAIIMKKSIFLKKMKEKGLYIRDII